MSSGSQEAPEPGRPWRRAARGELRIFTWKVLIVIGAAALVYMAATAAHVLLLIFTGVLLAIVLVRVAGWVGLRHGVALGLVLLLLTALLVGGAWVMGTMARTEFDRLGTALTEAYAALPQTIRTQIADNAHVTAVLGRLQSYVPTVLFGIADLLIVLFTAIYLAAQPALYRRGIVLLVPPRARKRAEQVLEVAGETLWLWLIGQACSMAIVGALTALGLWLVGIPVPVQLGLIAGVLEFVPYLGPILSAVPAVLIGFSQSPVDALWVVGIFVVVQQVEAYLIQPLVQRSVVEIPPVVTIAAVAIGGTLFGLIGVLVATPLAILVMTMINLLYLQDELGEERRFPPEERVPDPTPGETAARLREDESAA